VCLFPQEARSGITAVAPAFLRLTNLDWNADTLATFSLQAGYKRAAYFRNYTISGYEKRDISLSIQQKEPGLTVDLTKHTPSEVGIQIRLDVNNKAEANRREIMQDIEALMDEQVEAYSSLQEDFDLGGLL